MGRREELFLRLEAATPALRRYARALCASSSAAAPDDIVQTAIDRVAARIRARELREAEAARLAAYQSLTSLAREKSSALAGDDLRPSLRQSSLLRGLADLPFEERAALLLVALEGFGYDAAGQIVAAPREALVMRLMRARAALAPLDLRPSSAPHDGVRRAGPHLRVVK
jgi:DNA-directed RNA polymerase specialized sigma24 family protein